jgi:hypothetical protein
MEGEPKPAKKKGSRRKPKPKPLSADGDVDAPIVIGDAAVRKKKLRKPRTTAARDEADRTVEALLSPSREAPEQVQPSPQPVDHSADQDRTLDAMLSPRQHENIVDRAEDGTAMKNAFAARRTRGSTFSRKERSVSVGSAGSQRHSQRMQKPKTTMEEEEEEEEEKEKEEDSEKSAVFGVLRDARKMQSLMRDRRNSQRRDNDK